MAELSATRANFYKQIYFPTTYYREVFDLTLEEAGDIQKAQQELQKLLLDATENRTRLYAEVRPGKITPQSLREVDDAILTLEEYDKGQGKAANFAASLRRDPVGTLKLGEAINQAKVAPKGGSSSGFDVAARAIEAIESAARGYKDKNPDLAQKILAEGIAAAEREGIDFGKNPGALNNAVQRIAGAGKTRDDLFARVASAEGQAGVERFQGGTGPVPASVVAARKVVDAARSPYMDGKLEAKGHAATGLTDEEDELLKLYLQRLQDEASPGRVTAEEFEEANPGKDFAQAKAIYDEVATGGRFLKSAAEWFNEGYLAAVRTEDDLRKKAEIDPFDGLDPYRWSQREALKRGGYTKESLLHLRMLTDRPDVAPYVGPAFTRLRAEGGLEPKSAAEATISAAFQANPNLTLAELDALLQKKRQTITAAGRKAGRETEGGGRSWEAADLRKGARQSANELYGGQGPSEEAKAYLLALRLNRAGTPATPDTGTKIEIPVTAADIVPTPADLAAEAAAKAKRAAAPPAPPGGPPSDTIDLTDTPPPPAPPEGPASSGSEFVPDPSDPTYSYKKMPDGTYLYAYQGIPQGRAQPGTQAFKSIESVLGGGKALPPIRRRPPPPGPEQEPPPAPAPVPGSSSAAFLADFEEEAPAPAPAPAPKPVVEMTEEELDEAIKAAGGR